MQKSGSGGGRSISFDERWGLAMAVVNMTQITIRPERMAEGVESARRSMPMLERLGAKNPRFFTVLSGPSASTDTMIMTWEADDLEAWARVTQALYSDSEMAQAIASSAGPDTPNVSWTQSVLVQLDLG
jgi:hypothetical protein